MALDILAFGAHPDDAELFVGGTLAKMSAQGYATGIVDMTRGELGTRGTPRIRAREAAEAARILGLRVRENLSLPDGHIEVSPEARLRVIRALRRHRPAVVLVHYWEDRHPDHVNTSRLVTEAAHHAGLAKIRTRQERFRPQALLYYMLPPTVTPSFVVDVSEQSAIRKEAIEAYQSQLWDPASREPATYLSHGDFLSQIESIHAYYGSMIGRSMGEAFLYRGVAELRDPVSFFSDQSKTRFR